MGSFFVLLSKNSSSMTKQYFQWGSTYEAAFSKMTIRSRQLELQVNKNRKPQLRQLIVSNKPDISIL